jgi:hypothetical protein
MGVMGVCYKLHTIQIFLFSCLALPTEGAEKEKNLKIPSMGLSGKKVQFVVHP